MTQLNSKQRKLLEKYANNVESVVNVGSAGVSEGVIQKIDDEISRHELIKVKFNDFKDEKKELSFEIAESTKSILVRLIGNVAILYRTAEKVQDRKYEKELNKLS